MSKAANQINKALDNNVVELYGMSQSGKSSIAHEIAKKYPATLWIDSLFQYNFDGEYYLDVKIILMTLVMRYILAK